MQPLLLLLLTTTLALALEKPNIVFILVDDLGINDLGIEGSTYYETPRIDQLARESMRFTKAYSTCQVCSPSRASILTGQYPPRIGITDYIGAPIGKDWNRNDKILPASYLKSLPHKTVILPEALADAGYATWFFGKWHLGEKGSYPEDHGFQVNIGGQHQGSPPGGFFAPFDNPKLPKDIPAGTSLTLWLAEQTAHHIKQQKANKPDQPFLAYLSFYAVHSPIETTQTLWKKYRDKAAAQPHTGDRFKIDRTLPVRQVQDCPIYAGMMETLDQAVGLVLDTISQQGLTNDTIIIFTSDNGGVSSGDAYPTSALPLRGGKGRQWEGGLRAPCYIKAPGITKPGSSCDTPITGTDYYPTLLDLAGLPLRPDEHRDGISLKPLLTSAGKIKERPLFWHYPHYGNQGGEPSSIILSGDWKLIQYLEDQRNELYNLATDPSEETDLATQHPDKVQKLLAQLTTLQRETGALIPEKDARYDPAKKKEQLHRLHTQQKTNLEREHARYLQPDYQPEPTWWGSQAAD